jgi:hypothetical protein
MTELAKTGEGRVEQLALRPVAPLLLRATSGLVDGRRELGRRKRYTLSVSPTIKSDKSLFIVV